MSILVFLASGVLPAGWVAAYAAPVGLLAAATSVGLGASGGVARERQRNTLIDLFMLPGGRRDILRAKLVGAAWAGRWFLLAVGGMLDRRPARRDAGRGRPAPGAGGGRVPGVRRGAGLWLSVRARTALTAHASWMGFVALSLIGTYLLADATSRRGRSRCHLAVPSPAPPKKFPAWSRAVNPVMAWQELAMTPEDDPAEGYNGFREWDPRFWPKQPPAAAGTAGRRGHLWLSRRAPVVAGPATVRAGGAGGVTEWGPRAVTYGDALSARRWQPYGNETQ